MTKDGRLSPISNIRYLIAATDTYLSDMPTVTAFGQRMAWWLSGESVSIGPQPELYIYFTTELPEGQIEISDRRPEWWQLCAYAGVSDAFPHCDCAEAFAFQVTTDILGRLVQANRKPFVDDAANLTHRHGGNLRFLLRRRETRQYVVEVTCTIADRHDQSCFLFVALTDKVTGQYYAAPPAEIGSYLFAHKLSGLVKINGLSGRIPPDRVALHNFASLRQGLDLLWSLSDFVPSQRPVTSKAVM